MTAKTSPHADLVRPSRDGDQFHYAWAARRTLAMLLPASEVVAVTIEGVAAGEDEEVEAGLDVIDVAEYRGSTDLASARVTYLQLKHSTRQTNSPWQVSGLKRTLTKFGERYVELVARFGREDVAKRFFFAFETNRPIAETVTDAIVAIKAGADDTILAEATGLGNSDLRGFVAQLALNAQTPDYLEQRRLLGADLSAYLPENDKDAPLQLKDLVTRKATSEFATNPSITSHDVLHAIGASELDLYPAKSLIERPGELVDREQMPYLVAEIVDQRAPIIIQAEGGVGKSMLATSIGDGLPAGSVTLVYDCFGNGAYRSLSGHRHRPRDGLVQLANELAGQALCDPLIPTAKADAKAYARAFGARLEQSSASLRERNPLALLCLVIDAADNAETAAREAHDGPSFARMLLREPLPDNVRLVLTARTHRVALLDPPPATQRIDLLPFSLSETAANLRATFPDASSRDVQEFHRLTSSNPRVQATALAGAVSLESVLTGLGPEPLTVQDTIARLLEAAVAKVRYETPEIEQAQFDRVCEALATMRPFVPLALVARTADVPVSLVTSLANDLGRPLLVRDGSVQFRDEPTETWFRERFRPSASSLGDFVARLLPLASSSAYVAATLPQLMLEAEQFDALVQLSLEGGALPQDDAVARRDVELQRLRFALQAALRDRRYEAAAKLSLKAGGEVAAGERQQQLISANTDLSGHFFDAERMAEQVGRRQIEGGHWTGSEHAYEAAFLSGSPALAGDARNRLRIAYGWLNHWSRSPRDEGKDEPVGVADIAELAWAELNLHGARASAWQLRRWKPRHVAFSAGRIFVARLVDAARFDDVDALAWAAGNDIGLLLAIGLELSAVGRNPPSPVVQRAVALVASRHLKLEAPDHWKGDDTLLASLTALVAAAAASRLAPRRTLANLPARPSRSLGGQHANYDGARAGLIRAYALQAALRGRPLLLDHLATRGTRKALDSKHRHDADEERFREDVGALLPWARLWAAVTLGRVGPANVGQLLAETAAESAKAQGISYRDESATADEVAAWWGGIILATGTGAREWASFDAWRSTLRQPLRISTLLALAHRAARSAGEEGRALDLAHEAFDLAVREREDAEQKTETLIRLARAVLPASLPEARAYFEEAVVASGKIGSENLARWHAVLHLGEAAARGGCVDPETAYRFARAAELTYAFVVRDKHFDWEHTVETLADLSPPSALSILSRWLDRRFGREARLLPMIVGRLVTRRQLDARTALALLPFQCWWKPDRLLEEVLSAEPDARCRVVAAQHLIRYQRFSTDVEHLRKVNALLRANGIDLPEAAEALIRAELAEANRPRDRDERWTPPPRDNAFDWDGIFAGLSLTSGPDLLTAHVRFRSGEPPFSPDVFNRQAISRVRAGDEAAFLDALSESRSIDLLDVRALLEALPTAWKQRVSVRPAMQRLLRAACRRDAARVSADRYYQWLPWTLAFEFSGLTARELMGEAIHAIADTVVPDDAAGLFRLVGILSRQLSDGEALATLRYGLDLFEPSLEPTDGDGAWSPQLQPPGDVEEAVAGFVWAALGAPESERRWEAAHAVGALCLLRRDSVLRTLVAQAETGVAGAFADADLRFYDRHALLWLLIALARAANESGPAVAAHIDFLRRYARRDQPHVLQRGFAARAMLSLARQGLLALTASQVDELRAINTSRLPPVTKEEASRRPIGSSQPYDETRFSFGIDIGPYWLAPLGRVFGLGQNRVEDEVERVIREDWGLADSGRWDRDARATRRYFEHGALRHSHGTTPKVDDLQFYLSFHALMTVAGKLLETEPARADANDSWSSFSGWLLGHDLSRRDGLWLADRRDPTPADVFSLPIVADADWPASANADEAFRLLTLPDGMMAASGYWTSYAGKRKQVVSVSSALASRDQSEALVRALRTASNPTDFKISEFEDGLEINEPPYVLKGWVRDGTDERGLDEYDPWAANVSARVLAPADPFVRDLSLRADGGESRWYDTNGVPQLLSQSWSDGDDNEEESRNGSGRRLVAAAGCLEELMRLTGLDLVVVISLERKLIRSRYTLEREGEVANKVTEIVLLRPDREPWRISFNPRPRPGARRRARARRFH